MCSDGAYACIAPFFVAVWPEAIGHKAAREPEAEGGVIKKVAQCGYKVV